MKKSATLSNNGALQVRLTQQTPFALNVSLQCARGELLALTGPSGSGKTTVLRSIAGLNHTASGYIAVNDRVWQDTETGQFQTAQQRRVGLVFQQYALFPHLDALDNVQTAMSHVARAKRKQRAQEWLTLANMDGLQHQMPHQLSGGQRQRVALARALAREPDVLLLDEPFSAVDQLTREKLYRELAQIRSTLAVPMILVTHDMLEVQQLADTLCLMHHGSTLQSGEVENVMQRPLNARIARLLGHKNVFSVKFTNHGVGGRLHAFGTCLDIPKPASSQWIPADGDQVDILVDPSAIIMHRPDKPSNGERENPISTVVAESVCLGNDVALKLKVESTGESIAFRLSRHVAKRNSVTLNSQLNVSLLAEGIHLMPHLA